ncbi:MAG: GTPase HflX [Planctomycetes bacterium]|nr:GTPase HflX [Planctomycetota bacterium]
MAKAHDPLPGRSPGRDGGPLSGPAASKLDRTEGTTRPSERALLVKAQIKGRIDAENPLAEVTALAETAGVVVAGTILQKLTRPHPATYLGKGKVEEIAGLAQALDVDVVITDNDLSPAQERNLEEATRRKVVDRSQLIMDIFSQRARTKQAKMQVELAQLKYTMPRLKRLWTHLSRFEGGIGMRGPGETQLEEDKRIIERKIQKLARDLEAIEVRRESSFVHRRNEFVIALVGYTNAGKSTLLNRLTGSDELVEDKLFATLETRVRRWPLEVNRHVLLTDTVGFIRDLPHHLVASFHATLAETQQADLLFHVVDASSPEAIHQISTVRKVLGTLECAEKEAWVLFNKWDQVGPEILPEARNLEERLVPRERGFKISAQNGLGIPELQAAVVERIHGRDEEIEVLLPHHRGDLVAYLKQNGRVLESEYTAEGVRMRAALSPARLGKLRSLLPEGTELDGGTRPAPR